MQGPLVFTFQILFWFAAMAAISCWLGRSRLRPRPAAEARQLRQPVGILVISMVGLLMGAGAWFLSVFRPDGTQGLHTDVIFGSFALLGLYLSADYANARHEVDDDGMHFGRAFGRGGSFTWSEVERVGFNRHMNWYRITLRCGATVRLYGTLRGLPEFARAVLRYVPVTRIDAATHAMLQEAARERLHPLWK